MLALRTHDPLDVLLIHSSTLAKIDFYTCYTYHIKFEEVTYRKLKKKEKALEITNLDIVT